MLKPGWPGTAFRRTVKAGKKSKLLTFPPGLPVQVTADEFLALRPEIGIAIFEVERDEKDRPRFVETVDQPCQEPSPTV